MLANNGVLNEHNPAEYADVLPSQDRNAGTLVVDQNLFDGISFFFEGFYSERRSIELYTPGASPAKDTAITAIPVPTINPYYPTGAPGNLRVSYDLASGYGPVGEFWRNLRPLLLSASTQPAL